MALLTSPSASYARPNVGFRRIASRGEKRQVHETAEKLAKLRESYRLLCGVLRRRWELPVLILDGSRAPDQVTAESRDFVVTSREGLRGD